MQKLWRVHDEHWLIGIGQFQNSSQQHMHGGHDVAGKRKSKGVENKLGMIAEAMESALRALVDWHRPVSEQLTAAHARWPRCGGRKRDVEGRKEDLGGCRIIKKRKTNIG